MNKVNLGAPYEHRVTLRLTEEQFCFITKVASVLGVSPSDYLRMSINSSMVLSSAKLDAMFDTADNNNLKGKGGNDESVKTCCNNLV